jgi:hypothetical protein
LRAGFEGSQTAANLVQFRQAVTESAGESRSDNIVLPEHWFVTFYPVPDIRINYGDPVTGQTGRLFLPMDFLVGRNLTKNVIISLEIGVPIIKDYPVYDFKTVTRLNVKF